MDNDPTLETSGSRFKISDLDKLSEADKQAIARAKNAAKARARRDKLRAEQGELTYMQRRALSRERKKRALAEAEEADRKRRARAELLQRAYELFDQGVPKTKIAVELNRGVGTINGWLKGRVRPDPVEPTPDAAIQSDLEKTTDGLLADEYLAARDAEDETLMELAKSQNTPADQYQAYVASTAIKLLRDNFKAIRGPRTVRELSELDQLIRRNLGLNPRGGTGNGKALHIDISILNNTKATPRTGVAIPVDADEMELP